MNDLFPVFLKLDGRTVVVVGGGAVAREKVAALMANAPASLLRVVAPEIAGPIRSLAASLANIALVEREYRPSDLDDADLVIVAVDDPALSARVRRDARERRLLVNVADTPELCDFYLGSIVRKGDLKIAISTNGSSPTVAKRLREILADAIPEEIDEALGHMRIIRDDLKGDFARKVRRLNQITAVLAVGRKPDTSPRAEGGTSASEPPVGQERHSSTETGA